MIDERLKQIFEELTSINATSGNEAPVAEYIRNFVERLGLECHIDGAATLSGGNSGNVIVKIKGGGNISLQLTWTLLVLLQLLFANFLKTA